MRDEFLAGIDSATIQSVKKYGSEGKLLSIFTDFYKKGVLLKAVDEKYEAVAYWKEAVKYSKLVVSNNAANDNYIRVSTKYGYLLYQIIAAGWDVMAHGFIGDKTGTYNTNAIAKALNVYDASWTELNELKRSEPSCATLYKPYAFIYNAPNFHEDQGMQASIEKYRSKIRN
jgi:hypothetical protein